MNSSVHPILDIIAKAEAAKEKGMNRAAQTNAPYIWAAQIKLLRYMLRSDDGIATIDVTCDADEMVDKFRNAMWRGSIPRKLINDGIIQVIGSKNSCRPAAHARPLKLLKLVDRRGAIATIDRLQNQLKRLELN